MELLSLYSLSMPCLSMEIPESVAWITAKKLQSYCNDCG